MADQSLVPKDRPYGERQNTVESMRRAGLSLSPRPQAPAVAPAAASPSSQARPTPQQFDPLLETRPDQFPTLGAPTSSPGPLTPPQAMSARDAFLQAASTAQSGLMRSVASRLARR